MRAGDTLPVELPDAVREAVLAPLVDHDFHPVRGDDLTRARFETLITVADAPAPPGTTHFDTPAGLAVRRWCAPVLGLDPHVPPAVYLARRAELGAAEVNRRLLRAARITAFLVDTGRDGPEPLPAEEICRLDGAAAGEVAGVERAEQAVAISAVSGVSYISDLNHALAALVSRAVAFTVTLPVVFDAARPSRGAVIAAANRRLAAPKEELTDPVLLRHLLWAAFDAARERGLPVRFHLPRYGPHRALAAFLGATQQFGVPVVLLGSLDGDALHLAATFPHVYVDVGSVPAHAASGAAAVGRLLELVPFHKQLFGSGGRGAAESCHLGALHWRRGLAGALAVRLAAGEWSVPDAARVALMVGSGNARRVYRL
ncbi:amidohydrolase family protein [Streptosporangium saharense]|uniref:amidohydrolase family protein n=1 Tax=Streptosporangium saharense TaxID=1706840 RepID=UPI00369D794F